MNKKLEKFHKQFLRKLKRASHWPVCDLSKGHGLIVKLFVTRSLSKSTIYSIQNISENVIYVDTAQCRPVGGQPLFCTDPGEIE